MYENPRAFFFIHDGELFQLLLRFENLLLWGFKATCFSIMHMFRSVRNERVQSSTFLNFVLFSSHSSLLEKRRLFAFIRFDNQLAIAAMERCFWDSDFSRFPLKIKNLEERFRMNNSRSVFHLREKPGNLSYLFGGRRKMIFEVFSMMPLEVRKHL